MDFAFRSESDLDLSFTSCTSTSDTDRTGISSARSSVSQSEIRHSAAGPRQRHRCDDPLWSPIQSIRFQDGGVDIRHLNLIRELGSGDVGRVFLCNLKGFDRAKYALKVIDREALSVRNKHKVPHVQIESHLLSTFDHPFLPTLYSKFDFGRYTCFLIDYCSGGDLHALLRRQPGSKFEPCDVRFFAAEVLVALEYLHSKGIVYRDIKPENILRKEDGHVMLSDFDLCFLSEVDPKLERDVMDDRHDGGAVHFGCFRHRRPQPSGMPEFVAEPTSASSKASVGTHEYLAPEIISGKGHGNAVDWWAFGVLLYEMLYGFTPFKGGSKGETLWNITTKPLRFPAGSGDRPELAAANDLIKRLLVKDPKGRLGSVRGAADVKKHRFFATIRWPLIRTYAAPRFDANGQRRSCAARKSRKGIVRGRWSWKKLRTWLGARSRNARKS
ncbi:Serine/threonine-protein kinase [Nymphaea thermarum]|nr:Serine/threonine-protein kinase [Nymphaea thermarum]